jgi:DNA polymerase delta subunit 1
MVVFQAIAWESQDIDNEFTITAYGRAENGDSVSVSFPFEPYFFVKSRVIAEVQRDLPGAEYSLVQGKTLWGFTNSESLVLTKITCKTIEKFRKLSNQARWKKYQVFEATIDPLLRFFHRSGVRPAGWLEAIGLRAFHTTCKVDLMVESWRDVKPVDRDDLAPLTVASLDIECYSASGTFPNPDTPDDPVFQIAVTTKDRSVCLSLGTATGHRTFATERELLQGFKDLLMELDPDIITGWNIFGFDLEYLYKRMVLLNCEPDVFCWGRRRDASVQLVNKQLASSALGQNVLKMVPMTGRYVFDLFQTIKAEHRLESYSLNSVSKEFLGEEKHDMPIKELFRMYRDGEDLKRVADYCVQDTMLPLKLMKKLFTIENLVEMSKATWVPLSFLSERGQQIKVFSQVAKAARDLGFFIPSWVDSLAVLKRLNPGKTEEELTKFEGATVLEAQTGAYFRPIVALDFASLYPSIMMAHNLCYSTLVMDPKYDNLPGVVYEQHGPYRFAQAPAPSLLPKILAELKEFRKQAKKDMKAKPELASIYNGKQLAYKISMNSVYGFTGALKGMLSCVPIASSVTRRGREMIQESKEYVEAHFPGANVRYGDSVMPGTPVLTRNGPRTIETLGSNWEEYPGFKPDEDLFAKESSECAFDVWTSSGWARVQRVIRHRCAKKIYRVLTPTGCVDVTEDHSLLGPELEQLKPKDVSVGSPLFHSFPENFMNGHLISQELAYIFGIFVGDGSCGTYDGKYSWAINNKDLDLLDKCKKILEDIYKKEFKILDTVDSSGVYKLVPSHGDLKSYTEYFRNECYDGMAKKVPASVFFSDETMQAFLNGLFDTDGCRKDRDTIGCTRIDTKHQVTAQWYYLLLRTMGYQVSINTRKDKHNVFRLTWSGQLLKDPCTIKKIEVLYESWDGYVYDLETEAGTFQAGVGQIIVKNTDSIMVEFGPEDLETCWALGERASKEVTSLFKKPNDLELEKIYWPYVLYSKKRYAAKMWVHDGTKVVFDHIDIKGLQVVRRDNCEYVRATCQRVIEMLLDSQFVEVAKYVEQQREDLARGRVPMERLILSKRLGAEYKNPNLAHVVVRDKIRERTPGSEPMSGDRVQFVLVANKSKKMYEKAEDPEWVREHSLALDYQYYLKHQFETPVSDLMEPLQ